MHWHPANAQTRCRPLRLQVHVQGMWGGQRQPSSAGSAQARSSATYEADGITYNLLIVEGKPTWIQQREGGSLGAAGPGGTRAHRPQPGGRHGLGESSSENGHGRGDHHGRRGPAQRAGGHPAGDPVHGGRRRGVEGPGMPGGQGQSAAVPEGGGGSELPALPPPGGPGDPEEGGAA